MIDKTCIYPQRKIFVEYNTMKKRKTNRMPGYDYSAPGKYFITICVIDRMPVFGEIKNGIMNLNNNGEIVKRQWSWLGEQYKYITLDKFVIMPDHIHGIVVINDIGNFYAGNPSNRKHNLLSKTINALKTTSSKHIHLAGNVEFKWQRSFYDRIIRNDEELYRIRNYIKNNPSRHEGPNT